MSQEVTTTNSPFVSLSFLRRLLLRAVTTVVVSLLLLMGTQQEAAWAQSADAPQVYCGPWEIESNYSLESETRRDGEWQYWNYRWCYSPEVSGGWYQDYAGYSLTAPDATLTITPSDDSVAVGEPVTFRLTQTNNESDTYLSPVVTFLTFFYYAAPYEFVSASSSQGQCTFLTGGGVGPRGAVGCELGTLPPGDSAYMDIVVVPQEPGSLTGSVRSGFGVIGRAPAQINPSTEFSVTVESA